MAVCVSDSGVCASFEIVDLACLSPNEGWFSFSVYSSLSAYIPRALPRDVPGSM